MRRAVVAPLLLAGFTLLPACGKGKAAGATDAGPAKATVDTGAPANSAASATDAGPPATALKPQTQEQVLAAATADVTAATAAAKDKKPDCDAIVAKLDASYDIVLPKLDPDDRGAYATIASCARKLEHWRLLQQVANALIDADPGYKTSWQLPRALVGLGQYDVAARLGASILRSWPKEGDTYNTAALASSRIEDWEAVSKQADQAMLVQRQKGISDDVTAQAHVFKGLALLHQGKLDDAAHELDVAKKVKPGDDDIAKLRDRIDVVKTSGLFVDVDLPEAVFLGASHLYPKNVAPLGPLATFRMYNVGDKPTVQVRIELSLSGVAEPIGKAVTVTKGVRQVQKLTPPWKADLKIAAIKDPQPADVGYKITLVADGSTLFEGSQKATVEPRDRLPTFAEQHGDDWKPARELAAAWITPTAKAVTALLEAAKKRAPGGQFAGAQGPTLPQVSAIWEELRGRGATFVRDPSIDAEADHMRTARLPADVLAAGSGNALEGSLTFATLLEAVGLDVILVNVPGHIFVGWIPSSADKGTDAMKSTVSSPFGKVFFLETTMVTEAPADAAVLRGDAEFVERVAGRVFSEGRGTAFQLSKLRKQGVLPQPVE